MAVSFTAVASSYQVPSQSAYSSRKWRAAIVVSRSSSATQTTITVTLYFDGAKMDWGQVGKYVSGNIKIGGTTVKSFSAGDQSWNYTDLTEKKVLTASKTFNRSTAVQSIAVSGTVKVNSPSAYRNGNSSTASYNSTNSQVPALQTFSITYDKNGGTGTITTSGTYYYNQGTFSTYGLQDYTSALTRTYYKPTGYWVNGTRKISQSATYGTTQLLYQAATGTAWAGTANATAFTLKAEWVPDYTKPTMGTVTAYRNTASAGVPSTAPTQEDGTSVYVSFTYTGGLLVSTYQQPYIKITKTTGTTSTVIYGPTQQSSTSGTFKYNFTDFSADLSYILTIEVYDTNSNTDINTVMTNDKLTTTVKISTVTYAIDLKNNGNNVYMGVMHPATEGIKLSTPGLFADDSIKITKDGNGTESAIYISHAIVGKDAFVTTHRTDTNVMAAFGIGSGGENHGIYSMTRDKWMIFMTKSADYVYFTTHTVPHVTSTSTSTGFYLGVSANRWRQLYSYSAVNTASDGKNKDVISNLDFAKDLIMNLKPVEFQWKDSDHKRSHMGLIAQEAAKVGKTINKNLSFYEAQYIDGTNYNGEDTDDNNLQWGIMYTELIAPIIKVIQEQEVEIQSLKQRIEVLEER